MRVAGWTLIVMAVLLHFSVCQWSGGRWDSRIVPFLPVFAREQFLIHSNNSYNTMGAGLWGLLIPGALTGAGIGLILRAAKIKAILAQLVARAACEIGKQRYIVGKDAVDFFVKLVEQQGDGDHAS